MWVKIFERMNYVMVVAFLLSVAVQYNDPDPFLWMVVYGLAALACILWIFNKLHWGMSTMIGAGALIWGGLLLPSMFETPESVTMGELFGAVGMKTMAVEIAREFGGLLIVVLWMGVVTAMAFYRKSQ